MNAVTPIFLNFQYIIYTQDWWNSINRHPAPYNYDNFEVYINNTRKFRDGNKETNDLGCKWYRIPSTNNPRTQTFPGWAKGQLDLGIYPVRRSRFPSATTTGMTRFSTPIPTWIHSYYRLDLNILPNIKNRRSKSISTACFLYFRRFTTAR